MLENFRILCFIDFFLFFISFWILCGSSFGNFIRKNRIKIFAILSIVVFVVDIIEIILCKDLNPLNNPAFVIPLLISGFISVMLLFKKKKEIITFELNHDEYDIIGSSSVDFAFNYSVKNIIKSKNDNKIIALSMSPPNKNEDLTLTCTSLGDNCYSCVYYLTKNRSLKFSHILDVIITVVVLLLFSHTISSINYYFLSNITISDSFNEYRFYAPIVYILGKFGISYFKYGRDIFAKIMYFFTFIIYIFSLFMLLLAI